MQAAFFAPTQVPCGGTSPASPHSVVVSLPTLRDVIGYETGCPRVKSAIASGYPRFVESSLLCRVQGALLRRLQALPGAPAGLASAAVALVASQGFGVGMQAWVGSAARLSPSSAVVPGEHLLATLQAGAGAAAGWAGLVGPASGAHCWRGGEGAGGAGSAAAARSSACLAAPQWALVVCIPEGAAGSSADDASAASKIASRRSRDSGSFATASRRRAGGSVKWKRGCHVT
jgi:hypothetical protein